jgi:hypothetical protein
VTLNFGRSGLTLAALLLGCAHTPGRDAVEGAQKTAELFHHRTRWKDFGGAALLVVPKQRSAFEQARRLLGDERDLSIADYELDNVTLGPDYRSARVVSRVSWHRLPSLSQHDDTVVTELSWCDGAWLIARQTGGPFDGDLSGEAN